MGCGAFFYSYWFQHASGSEWAPINIMAKELVPIIISCAVWAPLLAHKQMQFQYDSQSLWFITATFNIHITSTHLPGIHNSAADMLSRDQSEEFLTTNPKPLDYLLLSRHPSTKPSLSPNVRLDFIIIPRPLHRHPNADPTASSINTDYSYLQLIFTYCRGRQRNFVSLLSLSNV